MNINEVYERLIEKISLEDVLRNEMMSKHTSFKIGGPADILVKPKRVEEVSYALDLCIDNNIDFLVIGNGSNLLVRDKGIRGVVIKIADNFNDVKIEGNKVKAQAGVLLSTLSKIILKESLEGFEFASGIPGTLGGAITMNAGAYGGEMKDVVTGATVIDNNGKIIYLNKEELGLGYRTSVVQKKDYIVLEVDMEFEKGDYNEIKSAIDDLTKKRTTKQPLHLPSAGSTFKRPEGYYAGKLIQDTGLKGVRVGDAQVSTLHSGFIVNLGKATAEDVFNLIKLVQKVVKDKFGVELETEVRILGEE